jgi:hypothetical protein
MRSTDCRWCDDARVRYEVSSRKTHNVHLFTRHGARRGASPEKARGLALCRITLLFDIKRAQGALYRVLSGQDRHVYLSHNTEMVGGRGCSGICGEFPAGGVAGCAELLQNF